MKFIFKNDNNIKQFLELECGLLYWYIFIQIYIYFCAAFGWPGRRVCLPGHTIYMIRKNIVMFWNFLVRISIIIIRWYGAETLLNGSTICINNWSSGFLSHWSQYIIFLLTSLKFFKVRTKKETNQLIWI